MNPFLGPLYALKGLRLIARPGLRRYVMVPLLVNTLLFSLGIWLGITYFDAYMAEVLPSGLEWLQWLLWPLFAITLMLVMFYTFTLIANVICSPFNGLLAEAVEKELTGKVTGSETSMTELIKTAPATVWAEVRKLGYFLVRAIPLLILFLIPGLNLFAPFLWFAFCAWLLAKEYFDYPMSNHGIEFSRQSAVIKPHRISGLSFGATITVLTMIPVVNFVVMPLAVAGATAMYLERVKDGAPRT